MLEKVLLFLVLALDVNLVVQSLQLPCVTYSFHHLMSAVSASFHLFLNELFFNVVQSIVKPFLFCHSVCGQNARHAVA